MPKNALLIFVKNAVAGKVKTRLAQSIGNEAALEIYLQLLEITASQTKLLAADKLVWYSEKITVGDVFDEAYFMKKVQNGNDLGEKMENAFVHAFAEGYENVVIVGSDCAEISKSVLEEAFVQLEKYDVVMGPAEDGGYYLLGMKKNLPFLFKNIPWSTSKVAEISQRLLRQNSVSYTCLSSLPDIDTLEDWQNWLRQQS
ncbi:MAG: TIGR04282 family arsenosugar biosynthesis glycosyltransferase [Chitinophagales bacterium]|nr:TIGR04282 family arsenosugar biosynthesis glycosyltransferase [Bacteroidota bacterium]MCB9043381.1 TIGR04282 family arsenosugar biosynthesis glycosyltransferase [Chitinophagales bacterium]